MDISGSSRGGLLFKPTRVMSPPGTHFVTFSTRQRQRLFVVESYVRIFLKTLFRHRGEGRYREPVDHHRGRS